METEASAPDPITSLSLATDRRQFRSCAAASGQRLRLS